MRKKLPTYYYELKVKFSLLVEHLLVEHLLVEHLLVEQSLVEHLLVEHLLVEHLLVEHLLVEHLLLEHLLVEHLLVEHLQVEHLQFYEETKRADSKTVVQNVLDAYTARAEMLLLRAELDSCSTTHLLTERHCTELGRAGCMERTYKHSKLPTSVVQD